MVMSHERVADVPELEVDHRDEVALVVVELTAVPDARREAAVALRLVPVEEPDAELGERVDMSLPLSVAALHVAVAGHAGVLARRGWTMPASIHGVGSSWCRRASCWRYSSTTTSRVASSTPWKCGTPGTRSISTQSMRPGVSMYRWRWGTGKPRSSISPWKSELVAQRERLRVGAVAAQHERQRLTVSLEVDEPGGPPPRLAHDVGDRAAERVLDDAGGPVGGGD